MSIWQLKPAVLALNVAVAAPIEQVFAALTDWPRQGEWMLSTTVNADSPTRLELSSALSPVSAH